MGGIVESDGREAAAPCGDGCSDFWWIFCDGAVGWVSSGGTPVSAWYWCGSQSCVVAGDGVGSQSCGVAGGGVGSQSCGVVGGGVARWCENRVRRRLTLWTTAVDPPGWIWSESRQDTRATGAS